MLAQGGAKTHCVVFSCDGGASCPPAASGCEEALASCSMASSTVETPAWRSAMMGVGVFMLGLAAIALVWKALCCMLQKRGPRFALSMMGGAREGARTWAQQGSARNSPPGERPA